MALQMQPKTPTYRFSADVTGMDLQQAVASQFQLFKNTIWGKADFKMEGTGASFNPEPAKGNLNAKGHLKVANATLATIDVGKMAMDAVNKSIDDLAAKYPQLKGKTLKPTGNTEAKYKEIASDFTISEAESFNSPNFTATAEPNRGFDFKGTTIVGLKDYGLNANWEVSDTYNILQAKSLNVDIAGTTVPHILTEGNSGIKFPIRIGGTCFAPVPNYGAVPEALAKVALANISQAAQARLKTEAQNQAQKAVGNALQGFGQKSTSGGEALRQDKSRLIERRTRTRPLFS